MSMNFFFRAFTQQEIDAMAQDHALIDKGVEDEKYALATDVETAWDVLMAILDGAGFPDGEFVDDALYNGCTLMSAALVQAQARALCGWTHEQVLERLRGLDPSADLYHQEVFQDDDEYLLAQFDALVAFYKGAAEKGLAALSYPA